MDVWELNPEGWDPLTEGLCLEICPSYLYSLFFKPDVIQERTNREQWEETGGQSYRKIC
jgi:hypothetical protein